MGSVIEGGTVIVTPDMARALLASSEGNFKTNAAYVTALANMMRSGEWVVGEPLLLDDSPIMAHEDAPPGRLTDGHNRMYAVIEHGSPVEFAYMRGYSRQEIWDKIGTGRLRQLPMLLAYDGCPNANQVTAVAKLALLWDRGLRPPTAYVAPRMRPTRGQLQEVIRGDNCIVIAPQMIGTGFGRIMKRSLGAFAYYIFGRIDPTHARVFFEDIKVGAALSPSDPALVLRNKLLLGKVEKSKHFRPSDSEVLAWLVKAWNASRYGRKLSPAGLKWTQQGDRIEPFPEPH